MKKIIPVKINSGRVKANTIERRAITDVVPRPTYRALSYADSRCIGNLNPSFIIERLSTDLASWENIEKLVKMNPELDELLKKYNLNIKHNGYNSQSYTNNHMLQTANLASIICDKIGIYVDRNSVIKAARLHDVGKVFIPSDILNKPENLTDEERTIMNVHAELGHKLLETLKIDPKTLNLIKNHHNYDKNSSIEQQIVSAADVFTALTEERPYKAQTPKEQALNIIAQYDFSPKVMDALKKAVA